MTIAETAPLPHDARGTHLIADLFGVEPAVLSDASALEALLRAAAKAAGARVLSAHFHGFGPKSGITGVLLLAESHISIHTWPEHAYSAVDIFMCGQAAPGRALQVIEDRLRPASVARRSIPRGGAAPALA